MHVGIQLNKLAESRLTVNPFFNQVITTSVPRNCRRAVRSSPTSIGKADIASADVYMVGYNIRLLPMIQSMAQIDATYAEDISHDYHQSALQIIVHSRAAGRSD